MGMFACKHTPPEVNNAESLPDEYAPPEGPWEYDYLFDSILYLSPRFIPNSNQSFVVKKDVSYVNPSFNLVKRDLKTQEEHFICERCAPFDHFAVWNNLVIYARIPTGTLHKVEMDTKKSMDFAQAQGMYHPLFFKQGASVRAINMDDGRSHLFEVATGQQVGLQPATGFWYTASKSELLAGYRSYKTQEGWHYEIVTYDSNTQQLESIKDSIIDINHFKGYIFDMDFHPNGKDLYCVINGGIYTVNIETKKGRFICQGTRSAIYSSVSISSDGKTLLCGVSIYKVTKPRVKQNSLRVYTLNIDGTQLKRIL